MGIAIWLVPPEGAFKPLEALISEIAAKQSSPVFQPHITLLSLPSGSRISSDSILPRKADLPETVPITFNKVCAGRSYFQSVLVELKLTAGSTLEELYNAVLGLDEGLLAGANTQSEEGSRYLRPYYPHLSLFYGDVPMEAREAIIKDLIEEGQVESVDGYPPLTIVGVEGGFLVVELWIVKCDGPTKDWQVLEKIKLSD
ncbi:hypothetical protein FRB96_005178 [Tulasnella sp. 330]|nr:hypothetical protein FRB96_005178 [Tulasnella sp. 330]KAG8880084.1 hypothetical protein FRB98_005352 [Tulasnella sp. 332]